MLTTHAPTPLLPTTPNFIAKSRIIEPLKWRKALCGAVSRDSVILLAAVGRVPCAKDLDHGAGPAHPCRRADPDRRAGPVALADVAGQAHSGAVLPADHK